MVFFPIKEAIPNLLTNNTSLLRVQQISFTYLCFELWAPDLNVTMQWLSQPNAQELKPFLLDSFLLIPKCAMPELIPASRNLFGYILISM